MRRSIALPGGHLEVGEQFSECAAREVMVSVHQSLLWSAYTASIAYSYLAKIMDQHYVVPDAVAARNGAHQQHRFGSHRLPLLIVLDSDSTHAFATALAAESITTS